MCQYYCSSFFLFRFNDSVSISIFARYKQDAINKFIDTFGQDFVDNFIINHEFKVDYSPYDIIMLDLFLDQVFIFRLKNDVKISVYASNKSEAIDKIKDTFSAEFVDTYIINNKCCLTYVNEFPYD